MVKIAKTINQSVSVHIYDEQIAISLKEAGNEILLPLLLLQEKLAENIIIIFNNFKIYFCLSQNEINLCDHFNYDAKIAKIRINTNSLSFIITYLLKIYRDDIAEAEHIDIDFPINSKQEVTLTIHSKHFTDRSGEDLLSYINI